MKRPLLLMFSIATYASLLSAQPPLQYLDFGNDGIAHAMIRDAQGNLYVSATISRPSAGALGAIVRSALVIKLDTAGSEVYRFFLADGSDTLPSRLALDSQNNLLIAGSTKPAGFPLISPIPIFAPPGTTTTGFISKVNATGTQLIFSSLLGGTNGSTEITGLSVEGNGRILLTGNTSAQDFPVTPDAYQPQFKNCEGTICNNSAFLTRISVLGNQLLYSSFLSGSRTVCPGTGSGCLFRHVGGSSASSIAIAADGTILVAGSTSQIDFPVTSGAFQTNCRCSGNSVGYVARFSEDGSRLIWSSFIGGSAEVIGNFPMGGATIRSLAIASNGSVIITGRTSSTDFPTTPGTIQTTFPGSSTSGSRDALFIAGLDRTGSSLEFSTLWGGRGVDSLSGSVLDADGNIWIIGSSTSTDAPMLPAALRLGPTFAVKISSDGQRLLRSDLLPAQAGNNSVVPLASGGVILLGDVGSLLRLPATDFAGPTILGEANSAGISVAGRVAPGEFISLYGVQLGPTTPLGARLDVTGRIATELAGVQILFDGVAAPLLYVSGNQINAAVPFGISGRPRTTMQFTKDGAALIRLSLTVVPARPHLFSRFDQNPSTAAAIGEDGSVISRENPARERSVISLFANGLGLLNQTVEDGTILDQPLPFPALPVKVRNGQPSSPLEAGSVVVEEVEYLGAAPRAVAGLIQINLRIPPLSDRIRGLVQLPFFLVVGDKVSPVVTVPVRAE